MNKEIIYISGYGRSGSTILEIFLANNLEVFSTGELSNLFDFFYNKRICECGASIQNCNFWNSVFSSSDIASSDLEYMDKVTRKAESFVTGYFYKREWKKVWEGTLNAIFDQCGNDIIIDSSKSTRDTFYRIKNLRNAGFRVHEIFLVRNPEDVMKSAKKGTNKLLETKKGNLKKNGSAIRAGISWFFTNNFVQNRLSKNESLIITYDEFVNNPNKTLSLVKSKFNLDCNKNSKERHGVSGNRLRRANKEIDIKKVKNKTKLSSIEKMLAQILNKYYNKIKRYRYNY